MAPSSNGLRRTPAVAAANGMTVRAVPVAYSVTLWPAAPELTPTAEDICGRTPAGRVSVRLVMNTAVPRASSADQGRTSRLVGEAVLIVMHRSCDPHIDVRVKSGLRGYC